MRLCTASYESPDRIFGAKLDLIDHFILPLLCGKHIFTFCRSKSPYTRATAGPTGDGFVLTNTLKGYISTTFIRNAME